MNVYLVEFREQQTQGEDVLVHVASSEDRAVAWIRQNGSTGWAPKTTDYFFAVFSFALDVNESPNDFLCYYDRFGNNMNKEDR